MLVLAAIGVLVAAVGVSTSLAGSLLAPLDWRIPGLAGGIYPWLLAASALVFLASQAVLLAPLVFPVGPTQAGPSRSGRAMEATWTALPVVFTLALSIYTLAISSVDPLP